MSQSNKRVLLTRTATPALDTNAYADGDHLGALVNLGKVHNPGGSVEVLGVQVLDTDDVALDLDVLLFNEEPSFVSSDNDPLNLNDANAAKLVAVVNVVAADYDDLGAGGQTVAYVGVSKLVQLAVKQESEEGGNLWLQLVARAAPTYSATGLTVKLVLRQD